MSPLLEAFRVLEVGGRRAAICGRLFAQLGADVLVVHRPGERFAADAEPGEALVLEANKRHVALDLSAAADRASFARLAADADLVVLDFSVPELEHLRLTAQGLRDLNPRLVVTSITPFGLTGPRRNYLGGDLIALHSSSVARAIEGRVADPEQQPPTRAPGEQGDVIVGMTAALASMNALYQQETSGAGQVIDVSAQEALSLMSAGEIARPAFDGAPVPRGGLVRGGTWSSPRLPTLDGSVAVSPRESAQWVQWLHVLGDPEWGSDPRFATGAERTKHYPALYELMAQWSRTRTAVEIAEICQSQRVPCFPFSTPAGMFVDPQLKERGFFVPLEGRAGPPVLVPQLPMGLPRSDYATPAMGEAGTLTWAPREARVLSPDAGSPDAGKRGLPLDGVRVLDFTWVVAGPTSTRYLALMGAEVIKVENPGRPDSNRNSQLHDVVGQSKLGLSIDLKADGALDAVRRLLKDTDVVVDNFAAGVMERLGLGYEDLRAMRSDIIQLSSSGYGSSGPRSGWVAYGSLLQAYAGFLEDPPPGQEPRSGMAWVDPLCGLFLGFSVVAALRARDRDGKGRLLDFSMLEAELWTVPGALVAAQIPGVKLRHAGNADPDYAPHDVYRCDGDDRWVAIAVTSDEQWRALCTVVPALRDLAALSVEDRRGRLAGIDAALAAWAQGHDSFEAMDTLQAAGVPASASFSTNDFFDDAHIRARAFYKRVTEHDGTERLLPGLPWHWGDDSLIQPRRAPGIGEDTDRILRSLAGLSETEAGALRLAGAFG